MKKIVFAIGALLTIYCNAQEKDTATLTIRHGAESSELQELLSFKRIDFYSIIISGESIKGKKFIVISKEFWDGTISKVDTIADLSKTPIPGLSQDTLLITSLAEKSDNDSLRISFNFSRIFGVTRKYKTTALKSYSTRDLSNGKSVSFEIGEYFPLLVYTLPYENPEYPGWLFYCELTSEGVPPAKWGEKYNLKHYIVFEMIIY